MKKNGILRVLFLVLLPTILSCQDNQAVQNLSSSSLAGNSATVPAPAYILPPAAALTPSKNPNPAPAQGLLQPVKTPSPLPIVLSSTQSSLKPSSTTSSQSASSNPLKIPSSIPTPGEPPPPTPTPTPTPGPSNIPVSILTPGQGNNDNPGQISLGLFFGDGAYQATIAMMGKTPAVFETFVDFNEDFPISFTNVSATYNAVPLITWKPISNASQVTAGHYDQYIANFARAASQVNHPIIIRLMHEMNGDWDVYGYPHSSTSDLVSAWRHVVDIFRANHVNNVKWAWVINARNVLDQVPNMYPGDDYVDWIGIDGYNGGSQSTWTPFKTIFGTTYNVLTNLTQKPMMIGETASGEVGGDKAAWIRQSYGVDVNAYPRIKLVIWFNLFKEQDWRINSSTASLTAIKSVFATWSSTLSY